MNFSKRTFRKLAVGLGAAIILTLLVAPFALAKVWTDKPDYAPGEVVTISGDNSDGVGYIEGATVMVDVYGPNGYTSQCFALVSGDPAVPFDESWSCQVVLNADESAIGDYTYVATQQDPFVQEQGTFTDGAIKVQARPKGITFTLTYQEYGEDDTTCNGSYTTYIKSVDSLNDTTTGQGNTYGSVLLIAPATSDQGGKFLYWTGPDSDSTVYSTNQSICVSNPQGNVTYFAHYSPILVTKTANTTFTRTYQWSIEKSVSPESWDLFTGDSGTSGYTVVTTLDGYTDSDWAVSGEIKIENKLGADVRIDSVSDSISGIGSVTPTCPVTFPYTLAAEGTLTCTYSQSLPNGTQRENTATVGVNITSGPPNPTNNSYSISDSADVIFGYPTTEVNKTVNVSDTNGDSWDYSYTGQGLPHSFTEYYGKTFTCDADEGDQENTVTLTGDDEDELDTSSATVTINCYALTVTKDANTSLTRTWNWTISKAAYDEQDEEVTELVLALNQSVNVNYEVIVDADSTDSDWDVSGKITISNPAPMAATLTSVSDLVSPDISADVDCPSLNVPARVGDVDGTLECTYSASLPDAVSRTNTATATLQNNSYDAVKNPTPSGTTDFTGTANVSFGSPTVSEVDDCVIVSDSYAGGPQNETVCAGDAPKTFSYTRKIGPYGTPNEYTVENTASFITNDTNTTGSADWTIEVTVLPNNSFSRVTSSSLCVFDRNSGVDGQQFNLLFTQDPKSASTYKLTASNPGQFYYNVFYAVSGPESLTIEIPFPFVTQGATPVHIYDGLEEYTDPATGETCYIPGTEISNLQETISLVDSPYTYTIDVDETSTGMVYVAIHLDYGLKGTIGYVKDGSNGASNGLYSVPDNQGYSFSFNDGGSTSDSQTVYSQNIFKKNPGISGTTLTGRIGDPVSNLKVQIYDGKNKLLGTVYSDKDGFYQWIYKYTGKPATFMIKVPAHGLVQSVTLKANGFLEVNFNNLP